MLELDGEVRGEAPPAPSERMIVIVPAARENEPVPPAMVAVAAPAGPIATIVPCSSSRVCAAEPWPSTELEYEPVRLPAASASSPVSLAAGDVPAPVIEPNAGSSPSD